MPIRFPGGPQWDGCRYLHCDIPYGYPIRHLYRSLVTTAISLVPENTRPAEFLFESIDRDEFLRLHHSCDDRTPGAFLPKEIFLTDGRNIMDDLAFRQGMENSDLSMKGLVFQDVGTSTCQGTWRATSRCCSSPRHQHDSFLYWSRWPQFTILYRGHLA
jgi:hypothetical protein